MIDIFNSIMYVVGIMTCVQGCIKGMNKYNQYNQQPIQPKPIQPIQPTLKQQQPTLKQPQPTQPKIITTNINDNIGKMCDILGLNHEHKHNVKMIKIQYKQKALQLHPDKNVNDTTLLFQEMKDAYTGLLKFNNE